KCCTTMKGNVRFRSRTSPAGAGAASAELSDGRQTTSRGSGSPSSPRRTSSLVRLAPERSIVRVAPSGAVSFSAPAGEPATYTASLLPPDKRFRRGLIVLLGGSSSCFGLRL